MTTSFQLQQHEVDYLRKAEQKRILLFPIDKALVDKLSLLSQVKQSLQRNKLFNEFKSKEQIQDKFHLSLVESMSNIIMTQHPESDNLDQMFGFDA